MDRVKESRRFLTFAISLVVLGLLVTGLALHSPGKTEAGDPEPICEPSVTACEVPTSTNTSVPSNAPTNTAEPSSTATNTAVPSNTPTNTAEPSSTATNTAEASTTPTETPIPTETSTEVPATPTESTLVVVTNTPEVVAQTVVTVESGAQGGGEQAVPLAPTATAVQQAAAITSLPATGSDSGGGRNDGMLYFGLGLVVLGLALAGTRLMTDRR
jgi:hypothetical protein